MSQILKDAKEAAAGALNTSAPKPSTHIDFEKGYDEFVAAHQKTWQHDRSQTLGASEVFGCMRKAWAAKHGVKKDDDYENRWGALWRGDVIENYFAAPGAEWFLQNLHGKTRLLWSGKDQRTLIEGRLSATPDGLVVDAPDDALAKYGIPSLGGTGCFNIEIKSIDPRVNLKEEKAIHRGQVNVQMGLTRIKTKYKPNYALIIYIDASFFDDIDIFIVPFDENAFQIAQQRADIVFTTKDPAQIMREGKIDDTCEYCPYQSWCAGVSRDSMPPDDKKSKAGKNDLPPEILEEFDEIIRTERAARAEFKLVKASLDDASERLKQWLRDTGVRRATSSDGGIKASISWVKGRKTPDLNAMRADGIDVDSYLAEGEGYDRLSVSEKGATRADEE